MDATSLRLGNAVEWLGDSPFIVSGLKDNGDITIKTVDNDSVNLTMGQSINPIELTEELLLKCGFVEDDAFAYLSNEEDSQYPVFRHNGFALLLKEGAFYVYEECDEDCWYNSYWHEIKYLHKLQNYIYETQDEEITINLT